MPDVGAPSKLFAPRSGAGAFVRSGPGLTFRAVSFRLFREMLSEKEAEATEKKGTERTAISKMKTLARIAVFIKRQGIVLRVGLVCIVSILLTDEILRNVSQQWPCHYLVARE
jgi:hypothetical protein